MLGALGRAVAFGRWHAADIRSILAAGAGVAQVRPAGEALVIPLPATATRPLAAYSLNSLHGGNDPTDGATGGPAAATRAGA